MPKSGADNRQIMDRLMDRGFLGEIAAFENHSKMCQSLGDLTSLIDAAIRGFGFRWFGLLHHVDFSKTDQAGIKLTTYPSVWRDELIESGMFLDGPVQAASKRSFGGFTWSQLRDIITVTDRHTAILERGRQYGLNQGYSLPVRMPDEPDGIFTVVQRSDEEITQEQALAARLLGSIAFDRARELHGDKVQPDPPIALSPRQIDCLQLVAQGKSDWEIGQILGLSKDTVHEYIEGARKRYGVRRRTQMVLRAVRDGNLDIDNLI
ncbi:regulatory protein, luxR family [Sphingobium sp. AP50]|uniref:helix-turn-helix transcriptional regulator n=1 Tax=Sphingobium sp. AP50 TaxID=1884369 RepID=UPI0008CFBFF8|nr:LuxR family transcriptional regulator [Sphingobium sp. AP50]SEJ81217.1 regulatory protein, luxR family [Sphingobium sp. AP50]